MLRPIVSILVPSEKGMRPPQAVCHASDHPPVSILVPSEKGMRPFGPGPRPRRCCWFQSSSPPRRGCAMGRTSSWYSLIRRFQSSSPPRRGCAGPTGRRRPGGYPVSILVPSEKGMRPPSAVRLPAQGVPVVSILVPSEKGMRPPAPISRCSGSGGFNPRPLREGDAPRDTLQDKIDHWVVSILVPSEKGMRLVRLLQLWAQN